MGCRERLDSEFMELWEKIAQPAVVHTESQVLLANAPFASMFGYVRAEEIEGRSLGEFFSPWPPTTPKMGTRTILGRRRNGTSLDIEITTVPFPCGGRLLFQSVVRDVSRLRSWEGRMLQSERLTAMGKLAGEIAHEINNPLGGILLYANLIKEDLVPGSTARMNLEKIIKLATRCRIIAKGLLNFGRSSSRSYDPVDLNRVVVEIYSMVEDHRLLKEVQVEMRLADDLPHIMADKGQMEQVVLNLLINAGEAMDGKGELLVETRRLPQERSIRLVVEDSGPGIPQELIPRIFEPFFTTKQPGHGTGLGLSITLGIVQRHGGRIEVVSRPGRGARFEVTLPEAAGGG